MVWMQLEGHVGPLYVLKDKMFVTDCDHGIMMLIHLILTLFASKC